MKTNMKVKELLNKDNWIKGCNARDINNSSVSALSPDACKWCMWGAIAKCYPEIFPIVTTIERSRRIILGCWNDAPETTWQDIEQLIKEFDL